MQDNAKELNGQNGKQIPKEKSFWNVFEVINTTLPEYYPLPNFLSATRAPARRRKIECQSHSQSLIFLRVPLPLALISKRVPLFLALLKKILIFIPIYLALCLYQRVTSEGQIILHTYLVENFLASNNLGGHIWGWIWDPSACSHKWFSEIWRVPLISSTPRFFRLPLPLPLWIFFPISTRARTLTFRSGNREWHSMSGTL